MGEIEEALKEFGEAIDDDNDRQAKRAAVNVCIVVGRMMDRFIMAVEAIEMNTRKS